MCCLLVNVNKIDGELPGFCIDFSKAEVSYRWDGLFTRTGTPEGLEKKDYDHYNIFSSCGHAFQLEHEEIEDGTYNEGPYVPQ